MNSQEISPAKMLFLGIVPGKQFFVFPAFKTNEQETLSLVIDSVERFLGSKQRDFREFDRKGEQPESFIKELGQLGLFGIIIPEEYGGLALSSKGYARVLQQVSLHDGSTGLTVGAHSSIGMKGIILFGNEEQKKRYLPKLAAGELIAAFCLTESGSGSDAASIRTTAEKDSKGDWILSGEKIWITNGAFADVFTVFARTGDAISAFIVERGFAGVSSGPKEDKMGIRASATTSVSFDKVKVPKQNLLGVEGDGFKVAMKILNSGRTGLGGGCVGAMKRCIELATKQASERKQFGRKIAEFPLIKEKIAEMTIKMFATESVVHVVGDRIDNGYEDYSIEAAISKVYGTESLWAVANEALQIAGGNGYMKEFPYEMIVRDARINMIFEGTNEILRLMIALSGVKEVGSYLKSVEKSFDNVLAEPLKELAHLSDYASKKITQYTPFKRGEIPVAGVLSEEGEIIKRYSLELARITEAVLRREGKDIINSQLTLKRLADSAIDLFVSLCVVSRVGTLYEKADLQSRPALLSIAKNFTLQARRRINQNLRRIERNEDEQTMKLADFVIARQGKLWDILGG
jgi:acyl-CoA dehydrogenase family protein 9